MNQDCCRAKRSQYQLPRSDAKDEERLAKRKDDMPPPLLRRIDNPRIREDLALLAFCSNTDKIHYATYEDAYAKSMVQLQSVHVPAVSEEKWWKR